MGERLRLTRIFGVALRSATLRRTTKYAFAPRTLRATKSASSYLPLFSSLLIRKRTFFPQTIETRRSISAIKGPRRVSMNITTPVPSGSFSRHVVPRGCRQTNLDLVRWRGRRPEAYIGHRRGTQLHIALPGRASLHVSLAGWQTSESRRVQHDAADAPQTPPLPPFLADNYCSGRTTDGTMVRRG